MNGQSSNEKSGQEMKLFIDGEWRTVEVKSLEPDKSYELYSEKYDVKGRIDDYGAVIKLLFEYRGKPREIGVHRPLDGDLAEKGLSIMESLIERQDEGPKGIFLHYWYIEPVGEYRIGHGIVTGHPRLPDTTDMHTSAIQSMRFDADREELMLNTMNNVYHCPMSYCSFRQQDNFPDVIENYGELKAKYEGTIKYPETEQGKVLLVLSDFDEYYFHSLCVRDGNGKRLNYTGNAHIGMFQDSYLVGADNVDIRWFPHYRNIEFYSRETDGMPLYAENIGSSTLYVIDGGCTYALRPGERKELIPANAEAAPPTDLPDGDLYPAGT